MSENDSPNRNTLKGRQGLERIWNATRYSRDGFMAAYRDEEAFRQIVHIACAGLPLAWLLGETWGDSALLAAVLLLIAYEFYNSAIEAGQIQEISQSLSIPRSGMYAFIAFASLLSALAALLGCFGAPPSHPAVSHPHVTEERAK